MCVFITFTPLSTYSTDFDSVKGSMGDTKMNQTASLSPSGLAAVRGTLNARKKCFCCCCFTCPVFSYSCFIDLLYKMITTSHMSLFKCTLIKCRVIPQTTRHISSAQWPHVAGDYHTGQHR